MALFKRGGSKHWWVSIYRGDGRTRLRRSTGTQDEAKAKAIEQMLKLAQQGHVKRDSLISALDDILETPTAAHLPLSGLADAYAASDPEIKQRTRRSRITAIRRFVRWMAEEFPIVQHVDQVGRDHVVAYCDWLRAEVGKNKTFNNHRTDLQTVFEKMMYRAGLAENPWKVVKNLSTNDSDSGRAFSSDEVQRLMVAARGDDDWECAQMVSLYTGLRKADCAQMRWDQLQGDIYELVPQKTARHAIAVQMPIHPALAAFLETWPKRGPWIMPILHRRGSINRYSTAYRKVIERAGIVDDGALITFHCWRHTFATNLGRAGVSKKVRDALGGWTTDIADRIYDHSVDLEALQAAIRSL